MTEILVSVVIPAFNCEDTIDKAINSVLQQTHESFELIIVDDASTDSTVKRVNSISDSRINLVHHKKNRGAAAARNTGMRQARGEYIAWLDADDEWLPEKLELQLEALENRATENVKGSYTAYSLVENGSSRLYIPKNPHGRDFFLRCDLSPGSTLLFERSVLESIGYLDETLPRYEDWDWLIRYAEKFLLVPVNLALVKVFHEHKTSAKDIVIASEAFLNKYDRVLRKYGWFFKKRVISIFFLEIAKYNFLECDYFRGAFNLLKGILSYPFQPPVFYLLRLKGLWGVFFRKKSSIVS